MEIIGRKILFTLFVSGYSLLPSLAQSDWLDAAIPGRSVTLQQVYSSPDADRVYFCGALIQNDSLGYNSNTVLCYSDGDWTTRGTIPQLVFSVVEYQDTLLATGGFEEVDDGLPASGIAFWNGTQWLPYGSFEMEGARKLRVLDDTLYAVGAMDTADGQYVGGVSRRIGAHWEPVGNLVTDYGSIMVDIVKVDGHLVTIGSGAIDGQYRVFDYENGVWSILGGGIQGGLCSAQCMAVYEGDLYVGGQITMACGNVGQGILRWDGSEWHPVGLGLQYALGDFSSFAGPTTMVEHNGLLYIGGGFRYAGGIEAFGIATWDGTEWCSVPGNFSNGIGHNGVMRMDFYHDTLFVAANMVDGDSVNFACKFIGENYQGTCTGPLVVPNGGGPVEDLRVFIGPENIRVELPGGISSAGTLRDAPGRMVSVRTGTTLTFSTHAMATGLYTIHVDGFQARRVFVP